MRSAHLAGAYSRWRWPSKGSCSNRLVAGVVAELDVGGVVAEQHDGRRGEHHLAATPNGKLLLMGTSVGRWSCRRGEERPALSMGHSFGGMHRFVNQAQEGTELRVTCPCSFLITRIDTRPGPH